jgi:HK97 family phage portal protein
VKAAKSLRRKTAEFFNSFFDFGGGALSGGFYPVAAGGQARPPVNASSSLTGHINTPNSTLSLAAAWACIWLISDTISTLPFILNRRSAPNLAYGEPAADMPLYQILHDSPNQQMSACEFWQVMIASDLLWGNGYAIKTSNSIGQLIALTPLRPEYVVPYRNLIPNTEPKQYEIRYKYYSPLEQFDYTADQIFHLKDRTLDGLVGLSRIEYARNSLGIARAAEDATAEVFKHGLRAGGFVKSDKFLKKEQRDALRDDLKKFAQGGPEQGGIMVLEGGLTWDSITMNPQDVQLLTSRQFAVEDVCRWFGVPPVLIGHTSAGTTAWGTGIEQLLLGWLMLNLRPYVRRIEQTVGRSLLTMPQRTTLYLHIDTSDLLGADSVSRGQLYGNLAQNGIMTRNEIRAREHLAPMDGGDELTVQSQLVPLDTLGDAPPDPKPMAPMHIVLPPTAQPPPASPPPSKQLN